MGIDVQRRDKAAIPEGLYCMTPEGAIHNVICVVYVLYGCIF